MFVIGNGYSNGRYDTSVKSGLLLNWEIFEFGTLGAADSYCQAEVLEIFQNSSTLYVVIPHLYQPSLSFELYPDLSHSVSYNFIGFSSVFETHL